MSNQLKTQKMAMKRSASYNGFSFGFPCRNDDLKLNEVALDGTSAFFGEWNAVNRHCHSLIRSPNHVVDCPISNGFAHEFHGLENPDISLTELSDASGGSDSVWQEELLRLRRQEATFEKDRAKLDEEIKTLRMKLELEEDLRRNDKECMDILRGHIFSLEGKLQCSEKKIRELEHERQRLEVSSVLTTTSTREFALVKARLDASKATIQALETDLKVIKGERSQLQRQRKESQDLVIKMEHQLNNANKELQRRENRINELVEERRSLEDYQLKARSLQRKDQKSSYALQTQIVNLQEKLEISERASEELGREKVNLLDKIKQLENTVKELQGSYRSKLEHAIERLKTMKCFSQEEAFPNSFNEDLTLKSSLLIDASDPTFNLTHQSLTLLTALDKHKVDFSYNGTVLEHLKHALREFLKQVSEDGTHELNGSKFMEKPLRLYSTAKETNQEELVTNYGGCDTANRSQSKIENSTQKAPFFTVKKVTREKFTPCSPDLREKRQTASKPVSRSRHKRKSPGKEGEKTSLRYQTES